MISEEYSLAVSQESGLGSTIRQNQHTVWAFALLFYGVGDTVTTTIGLRAEQTAEIGPVALPVIENAGIPGLVLLKLVFFAVCYGCWAVTDRPSRVAIPAALAFAGVAVTLWNSLMLLL